MAQNTLPVESTLSGYALVRQKNGNEVIIAVGSLYDMYQRRDDLNAYRLDGETFVVLVVKSVVVDRSR